MIGPYDLSGSYGVPGQTEHSLVKEACLKVIKTCEKIWEKLRYTNIKYQVSIILMKLLNWVIPM